MKKLICSVIVLIGLVFIGCTSYDDYGSNRYIRLEIQDAILVDTDRNYTVGDTIYIDLSFSRYLDEEGYANKLDIFESSGAESFSYILGLEKFSAQSNGFRIIQIDESYLFAEKGMLQDFGGIVATLNDEKTEYESRIGLELVEAGSFRFDFEYLYLNDYGYREDKVQIEIQHAFSNGLDKPEFEVTE